MNNPTQPPTNNAVLMTTSPVAWGFHGNYEDFVKNELVPVENPPADGKCAICRLDLAHQDQREEEPSDEHVYGMTTQDRILAAAIAAATVEETPRGNVIQIWKCNHFFHKDCICTWIDGDVAATAARRSCPLCKTELVRYDPLARARALCREIRTHQETIKGLQVVYQDAFNVRKRVQDLRMNIDRLRREFSHEPHGPSREYLRGQLQDLTEAPDITEEQPFLVRLDRFSRCGYSVSDSIEIVYRHQLGAAEARFQNKKREIKARLRPIYTQLNETEQILIELAEVLYQSWGYSPAHASARLLEEFGPANLSPDDMSPWLLAALNGQSNLETDLHHVGIDAEWMRKKADWTEDWLDPAGRHGRPPVNAGRVEDEEHEGTAQEGGGPSAVHIEDVEELGESHQRDEWEEYAGVGYIEVDDEEEEDESVVYTENVEEQEEEDQDQDELYHEMAEMDLGPRATPHEFL